MIQHTQNTIRFCKNVPKEKLQELISGALVPGKDEQARFDIRFLLPMPGNDCREELWDVANFVIGDVAWDADSRELSFPTKLGTPVFLFKTLAKAFPAVSFDWSSRLDGFATGIGSARRGRFEGEASNVLEPRDVCRALHGCC